MSMSVGASSSSALSYLQSLLQQGTSGAGDSKDTKKASATDPLSMLMQAMSGDGSSSGQTSSTASSTTTSTGSSSTAFSPETMAALLSAQGQQSSDVSGKMFSKLDGDGDGKVSKTEFTDAATKAGGDSSVAEAVFAKIDSDGDGSISQSELTKAGPGSPPGEIGGAAASSDSEGSGTSATSGATTTTTTNADGSTTTSITYADGSKVTMTTAAQSSDTSSGSSDSSTDSSAKSSSAKSAFDLLEKLIKMQSQMLTAATSTMSAIA